jgi:phosphoglycerate dehydrogenase-like enzyme
LARLLRALGLQVTAVRTHAAAPVDGVRMSTYAELMQVLPQTDWLILACPLTEITRGLVDARVLSALPAGAHLVNVARGEVVHERDLIRALQSGHLGGAFLDVFQHEPLPPESTLWGMPNVIITPHGAGHSDGNESRVAELFLANLSRWVSAQPLHNLVTGNG